MEDSMRSVRIRPIALAMLAVAAASPSLLAAERTGQQVVDQVCSQCHAKGVNGAPRIGDEKAWQARASRGLSSLTQSAIQGVRAMPPHGGAKDVSDLELSRAITYMVNQSGGHWNEPTDRLAPAKERTGSEIVQAQCVKCHGTGVGGAPRIGDRKAWIERAHLGLDSLVASAIHGHGGMPARGGMADLTDPEVRAAVSYMVNTSIKDGK
jgi:cytochrome c5